MSLNSRITLRQLRALKAVAEHGTIAAAADTLGLTGPAVHSQLKNLEEILETPVLENAAGGRRAPTAAGAALLRAEKEIAGALGRAVEEIEALKAGACGSVSLGVVSTAKYFAPRIVALLEREMPEIRVSLTIGNRGEILAALERHAFDLCITGRPPRQPPVVARALGPHPHVIIAPPDHPAAGAERLWPGELAQERFVMREPGSGTRILAERFLADIAEGVEMRMIEMGSNETIKQAVMSGLGIALISAHTVAAELAEGRLVALKVRGTPIFRTWYLTWPAAQELRPAAARVQDWILASSASFLPELDDLI